MTNFKIRVLKPDALASMTIEIRHTTEDEAVLWARNYAEGYGFQVWRDSLCIHEEGAEKKSSDNRAA